MTTVDPIPRGRGRTARLSRAERAALSDEKLIQASLELIAECGIERVTLRSIGERAGYSRGLVNYRFGTKEALLKEATHRLVKRWAQEAFPTEGPEAEGIHALRGFVARHGGSLDSLECRAYYTLVYAALGPMPELRQELADVHVEIRQRLAAYIRQGIEAGDVRSDVDAGRYAAWIYGAVRGIAYQWFLDPEAVDLDSAYSELSHAIERSLVATS